MSDTASTYTILGSDVEIGTETLGSFPWGTCISAGETESTEVKKFPTGANGATGTVVLFDPSREMSLELIAKKENGSLVIPPKAGDIFDVNGTKYIALAGAEVKYATGDAVKYTVKLTHFPSVNLSNIA